MIRDIPIASSLILQAQYDDERQELLLTFRSNGHRWAYGSPSRPFTPADAEAFESAGSAGQWFLNSIKGQWPERRA